MKKTLNDLWYNNMLEECSMIEDEKEKEIQSKATKIEEELRAGLSKQQTEQLESFIGCLYDMNSFFLERAFEKGICFATSYLVEALNEK